MKTSELINLLCLPHSYPHSVEVITTIETHISVVFLTGPYAYKLKKNVNFGFLDFSTLAQRKRYCTLELQLNQRYSPQLYLDVVAIYLDEHNQITWQPTPKHPDPIDYLVKMNQFDPNDVLGKKLQTETLSTQQIEALASLIANFHQQAESITGSSILSQTASSQALGSPKVILQPMLDNFPTLYAHFKDKDMACLRKLETWTQQQFNQLSPEIQSRLDEGYVRACHGDLHIDNITLIQLKPVLFDGIEFNDAFRWIDVISDLAFLLIDLDFRNKTELSRQILSLYLSQTTDYNALKLLPFYQVYRSLVRAKITALRAQQLPEKNLEKAHLMHTSLQYMHLALSYTKPKTQPQLILLQGISGSGKSHFATQLLQLTDALILSSDRVRKQHYGISPLHRVSDSEKKALYSSKMNQTVYSTLVKQAEQILSIGLNVIIDATCLQYQHRVPFYKMCLQNTVPGKVIYIETSKALAALAIHSRQQQNNNPSDADLSVMLNQSRILEPPKESENALILNAQQLRHFFPTPLIQEFLNRPI